MRLHGLHKQEGIGQTDLDYIRAPLNLNPFILLLETLFFPGSVFVSGTALTHSSLSVHPSLLLSVFREKKSETDMKKESIRMFLEGFLEDQGPLGIPVSKVIG